MRQPSFNIVQAAVVLLVVIVAIAIILPMLGGTGRGAPHMQDSTQLRGIHQGLFIYAQSNRGYFPGLDSEGHEADYELDWSDWTEADGPVIRAGVGVENRFAVLLAGYYLSPEYLISRFENHPSIKPWPEQGPFDRRHYSFAMLQLPDEDKGGRRDEWRETLNSQAIVVSDRNTGSKAKPSSIHVDKGEPWAGRVLWNDNHVGYENTDAFETRYGSGTLNDADRLFEAAGQHDALMVHSGN